MLPEAFLDMMHQQLGGAYEAFLQSYQEEKYSALRCNPLKRGPLKTDEAAEPETLEKEASLRKYFHVTHVSWEKNGYYYASEDQPGKHPLHEAGVYYIQEPSAMAVAPLLQAQPGEKILDLCAAPGGKSTQIAGYMQGEGLLVANEIHPGRAKILSENMERLGVRNVCVTNETPTVLSEKFPEYFHRILVDAPCSGEGMFSKNPEACAEWRPENVALCARRQDEILDEAAKMLMPGGRLVYSTCTFAPEENEGSIRRFLRRHAEFELLAIDKNAMGLPEGLCDGRPEWADAGSDVSDDAPGGRGGSSGNGVPDGRYDLRRTLRLWPQVVRGEGHFAAVLQKQGAYTADQETFAAGGCERGISLKDKDLEPWRQFWQETGSAAAQKREENKALSADVRFNDDQGIFLRFGENVYFAPKGMPALKGLKVLRPGLQLGTIKKNRFEPSHALALALAENDARHVCHFDLDNEDEAKLVTAYLNGQTFPMEGEKGWYLITVDGYSIGWGKLAGGIMKNHYPKGLRK